MTAGDGLIRPVKNEDVADDAAIDESKLDFDETLGHDHDGAASKKVDASNTVNTPAGTVDATNVQAAINELDADATLIRNDIDYPTTIKQKAIVDTGEDGGVEGGVFNGDFEYGSGSRSTNGWIGDEKYGWFNNILATACLASYDNKIRYNGFQSLKLSCTDVTGRIYAYQGVIDECFRIYIKPSTQYRLSAMIKTNNVATNSAYIGCNQYDDNGIIGTTLTSTKLSGNNGWTYVEIVFTSDADADMLKINVANIVAGNISDAWFDDIKLEQIDTQTVNTQLDEPVSVSIEGVTTTDNIDQYLETSGQTYTLTTAIDEGATHRQTFTPTADRGDGKHILTKIQALVAAVGTGNWTLVVHDAANNVLVSKAIAVGSMSTGDVNFDVPAILDVGTAYHFHITSTVADGTVTTTDANDLETVDYHAQFAKHTESPIVEANGSKLDLTGVKLLTGATITVNVDGSGKYIWNEQIADNGRAAINCLESTNVNNFNTVAIHSLRGNADNMLIYKMNFKCPAKTAKIITEIYEGTARSGDIYYSLDGISYILLNTGDVAGSDTPVKHIFEINTSNSSILFIKFNMNYITGPWLISYIIVEAVLDCQAALPIFSPSSEVTTETEDLTLNPIDISEDGYQQLTSDLTGWASRTITMLASEAAFESQAVSDNYIYIYDSNGTTPWTWDERNGLVPPADRNSGVVMAKFHVGDNQIRSSVNNGSMKANVNLAWKEESLRAAMNRLTELANLQYPIVVEVEDVPAIDLQDQPTGADAETGYTNDVTSLRQTAAATPAIAYTGLLPRENNFSEWLDITVVCSDGDGTLQGKLYTADGTLIETHADLESNPVIQISNPDYKYSRERLILQISASLETTSTAWSVTDIKWRYQYDGA